MTTFARRATIRAWGSLTGRGRQERGVETMGERVRSLRRSAGLSQEELAAGRFSKEYVSQIERGKTWPTSETLDWLADRLATDREFLEHGLTLADSQRLEAVLVAAERHPRGGAVRRRAEGIRGRSRAGRRREPCTERSHSGCCSERHGRTSVSGSSLLRWLCSSRRPTLAVGAGFTDVDRAEIVFRVGVVRYSESSINEAIVLFAQALLLAESSDLSADRLRSDILHWRARCHRRNRDWYAAQEDIERALELAEASSDPRRAADALFQASLVAQRQGRWVLARTYAEQSRTLFEELG